MFNLTRQEKLVIIFAAAALIAGCAVLFYKETISSYFAAYPKEEAIQVKKEPRLININKASEKELSSLPKIGPAMAKRIIEYRTNSGLFLLKEDLLKVKGISPKIYKSIESLITTQ